MQKSPSIEGWGAKHIKYILYEILRTLLYIHVFILIIIECTYCS